MNKVLSISALQSTITSFRLQQKTVGFVPTMGALHEGHLSLIREARKKTDVVVVSIFVNPTQFAPGEDFSKYPRDLNRDVDLIQNAGGDIVFAPTVEEMYPNGFATYVTVEGLASVLEGKFRPTHFKGVTTIVNKLFNIVQADRAFFGQKDAQQCIVIKKMVSDLNIPISIEIVPTIRENDGLAMSSRNVYLSPQERSSAPILFHSLKHAEEMIKLGEMDSEKIITQMKDMLRTKNPATIDYVEIVNAESLEPVHKLQKGNSILIPLAVRFGSTRLIDNILITV